MIAGPARYNMKKHEQKMNRLDNWFKNEANLIYTNNDNPIYKKINGTLTKEYSDAIFSNDKNAIDKLNTKLEKLESKQEEMKSMNAYYRKNKTMKGYKGLSDSEALQMDKDTIRFNQAAPFASFELSNNRQNINATKGRVTSISRIKKTTKSDYAPVEGVEVIEDKEQMRIQLKFPGKPDEETRALLKSRGFRWSPKNQAWQRQLTPNGRYAAGRIMDELNAKQPKKKKATIKKKTATKLNPYTRTKKQPKKKKKKSTASRSMISDEDAELIDAVYTPYMRTRSGKVIYAKNYGKKAFKIDL